MRFLRVIVFSLAMLCGIASCTNDKKGKKIISVTIVPQQYFAEKIAGGKYEINTMVPAGSSPESYDPSPSTLINLDKSEAYFLIGKIGFENAWADKLRSDYPNIKFFDNSKNIEFIENHDDEDSAHGHHHGGEDPHIWTSPKNALTIAANMLDAFVRLDPTNKEYYISNYNNLVREIDSTKTVVDSLVASSQHKSFVIYHPSLTYFAKDYNLKQLSIENDGKEPSAMLLKNIINQIRIDSATVIFIQEEFDKKNAEVIAREIGGTIVPVNPLSYDWSGEMIKIAKALRGL